ADDTSPDVGIQYAHDPENTERQQLVGHAPASPGAVSAGQVPDGLMVPAEDSTRPEVTDHTAAEVTPEEDFTVDLGISDDVEVLTATLEVGNDVDGEPRTVNLTDDGDGRYSHTIPAVDLTGKEWVEYTVTAHDRLGSTTTETRRVPVAGVDTSPVRLNLEDGQFVTGTTRVSAAGEEYPPAVDLSIDGVPVSATEESLEDEPWFAFEATSTDAFFRNGVLIGEEVLHVFDEGFYAEEVTVAVPVPLSYVTQGEDLVLSVYAGTKAWPEIDEDENNDDFQVRNLRLVLPDGRTLRPDGYDDPAEWLRMGDSAGKLDFYDAQFPLPGDAFTAVAHDWDTTATGDGHHTVAASDGSTTVERAVQVDNTAPVIETDLQERQYQGEIVIDAQATDAGAGLRELTAALDGEPVELPHTTSSVDLAAGEHEVVLSARDEVGNTSTRRVVFTTPEEQPSGSPVGPADGATVRDDDVLLTAEVEDPTGDALAVELREGSRLVPGDDGLTAASGTTRVALGIDRDDAVVLSGEELAAMAGDDGLDTEVASSDAFPYQLFDVQVGDATGEDDLVRVGWDGRANAGAKVLLYAQHAETGEWVEVDRALTTGDNGTDITLEGMVTAADHAAEGTVRLLVQHSEGFAGQDLSTRDSDVTPHHPDDVPRSEYDFTIGWESDTQYYNETYYQRQLDIHDYFLDRRQPLNLQYVIHTGDVVDEYDQEYQWRNADPAYRMLEDAGLPYGVLAGNHDVGGALEDYREFSRWFGEDRFADNPWYGGSYQDNRGHYDLITAGGVDFLMLSMGWGPDDEAIAWMNQVLARYPERTAVINLHEYVLTTGGLGPIPQRIQDEVVATNPNVVAVTSGHYHDAFTRVDEFDDDGDGQPDRTVHQMLFDYQGLPEGGQAFLRLLHFDNEGERMLVRTYSPYLDTYNSEDPSLELEHQEFEVPYADLQITPREKVLATDDLVVEVLTDEVIASVDGVASGSTVQQWWYDRANGDHGWYVLTRDPHGGVHRSEVATVTVDAPGNGRPRPDQPKRPRPGPPEEPGAGRGK
ncbi:metallophosphoesterase, partial [Ornithinicoccus halotolerans]|uniref:metallophosphoesterase n=1 Tax=Ornithinicoccus halotolerans TaxID=1748220 RepID=UPI001885F3F6